MTRLRRLLALALLPLLLALTGCTLSGAVAVKSPELLTVDLTFSDFGTGNYDLCDESMFLGSGLQFAVESDNSGPTCHLTGDVDPKRLETAGVRVHRVGEYIVFEVVRDRSAEGYFPPVYLTLAFPGQVVEHNAAEQIAPNQIRLTDLNELSGDGLRVVALGHAGPPWWVIGVAGGVLAGALLALAVVFAIRRRSRKPAPSVAVPVEIPADATPASPATPEDAVAPAAPAAAPFAGPIEPVPVDPSGFEPPKEPVDITVWAPPRDD